MTFLKRIWFRLLRLVLWPLNQLEAIYLTKLITEIAQNLPKGWMRGEGVQGVAVSIGFIKPSATGPIWANISLAFDPQGSGQPSIIVGASRPHRGTNRPVNLFERNEIERAFDLNYLRGIRGGPWREIGNARLRAYHFSPWAFLTWRVARPSVLS